MFSVLASLNIQQTTYIFFDELEVFYDSPEKYVRDQRMVRDLLFSIDQFNKFFRLNKKPVHVIGAVRSEVVDAFGALGQEVDRVVHDQGVQITWHNERKSTHHSLIEIVRRKIKISEQESGIIASVDPIEAYFPKMVNGVTLDSFLLDRSFYKPRDLIWRLTLAQKQFPREKRFSEEVLHRSEIEYSAKLWEEIRYELSAAYSNKEIDAIQMGLSGGSVTFDLPSIHNKFERAATFSEAV